MSKHQICEDLDISGRIFGFEDVNLHVIMQTLYIAYGYCLPAPTSFTQISRRNATTPSANIIVMKYHLAASDLESLLPEPKPSKRSSALLVVCCALTMNRTIAEDWNSRYSIDSI